MPRFFRLLIPSGIPACLAAIQLLFPGCSSQKPTARVEEPSPPIVQARIAQAGDYGYSPSDSAFYRAHPEVSPPTVVHISALRSDSVAVDLYDIEGGLLGHLFSGTLPKGEYQLNFTENHLASGVYVVRYHFSDSTFSRKILFLRANN